MSYEKLLAIIGAAAWLPHIFTWVYRASQRPIITFVPEKIADVGFTSLGPIFNLSIAFAAERKDAILDKLELEMIHENGEKRTFEWFGMTERVSDMKDAAGNVVNIDKDQRVIALKLSTTGLIEKFVKFQESKFIVSRTLPIQKASEQFQYLLKIKADCYEDMLNSKEAHNLMEFYDSSFWWKEGKYTLKFMVQSPNNAKTKEQAFEFKLEPLDIKLLEANLDKMREYYKDLIYQRKPGYQKKDIQWHWRNINLKKI